MSSGGKHIGWMLGFDGQRLTSILHRASALASITTAKLRDGEEEIHNEGMQ